MVRPYLWLISAAALFPTLANADENPVFPFIQKSCVGCHNATVTSGDLNLEALRSAKTFDEKREVWERVASKLKTGQMPPPGIPRPPQADVLAVTRWLEAEFARQDRSMFPKPGRITARRLNRAEYNNTCGTCSASICSRRRTFRRTNRHTDSTTSAMR